MMNKREMLSGATQQTALTSRRQLGALLSSRSFLTVAPRCARARTLGRSCSSLATGVRGHYTFLSRRADTQRVHMLPQPRSCAAIFKCAQKASEVLLKRMGVSV